METRHANDQCIEALRQLLKHFDAGGVITSYTGTFCGQVIIQAGTLLSDAFRCNGKLITCGNGGSAADCQHMAAEFTNRLSADVNRPGLPAIALTTDTSFLTGYANDFNFHGIFARQVEALGKQGDVLLAISTSGNSENVLLAVEKARAMGLHTIGLTGATGKLREIVDVAICIPSTNTQHIQEAHLVVEHVICNLVERQLFPELFEDIPEPDPKHSHESLEAVSKPIRLLNRLASELHTTGVERSLPHENDPDLVAVSRSQLHRVQDGTKTGTH